MSFVSGVSSSERRGRCYVVHGQALAVIRDGERVNVPLADVDDSWLYLGALAGEPCFAREAAELVDAEPVALRALFGALPDAEFAVAQRALGIVAWDRDHRFCGRCGTATERSATERVRTCPACKLGVYPRLSPAVIVRVERDDTILLARNLRSPFRFHSVLAGFVELGESLEATVHREISEEVGIEIADVRYFGSQPWPFTNSLMIAFTARWLRGELAPDGIEIGEAAWFARDQLPDVPPRLSIARALIDDFVHRGP